MVTGIVMVNTRRDVVNETAETLAALEGVAEVYSITGEWDLVAIVRTKTNDELAEVVTKHVGKVDGIVKTETHVAFRAFSRHDLETMFGIGL